MCWFLEHTCECSNPGCDRKYKYETGDRLLCTPRVAISARECRTGVIVQTDFGCERENELCGLCPFCWHVLVHECGQCRVTDDPEETIQCPEFRADCIYEGLTVVWWKGQEPGLSHYAVKRGWLERNVVEGAPW